MVTDCLLTAAGIGLFAILAALHKETVADKKLTLVQLVSRIAIASGGFVTTLKLLLLITELEGYLTTESNPYSDLDFSEFIITIVVQFRPLLLGIIIRLVLNPLTWQNKKSVIPSPSVSTDIFSPLSPREREVARLAIKGWTNAQIADELFISVETVKRHMSTIFEKLSIKSRRELMNLCPQKPDNVLQ